MYMYSGANIDFDYKFRTISVEHLGELQEDIDKLRREGKLSDNKTYRGYIDSKKFEIPETLPNAKSIVILAIFSKPALVNFHLNGNKHEVIIPPNYYDSGTTFEDFEMLLLDDIIKEPGYKVEFTNKLHVKLLAVRSGLGMYGRNNICYVDEWGSMINLFAYFTDFQFKDDNWTKLKMMDQCENCSVCIKNCPTHAIPTIFNENFVIDAGKCISVYNEIKGIIPDWIPPDAHNALMGCMRCQKKCPANRDVIKLTERFEDITDDETKMLLNGKYNEKLGKSLSKKLKMFTLPDAERLLPVIKRNLLYLLRS
ncbi:MAG: 4Fe-4S double cluster binding domain-containing protein [Candidatus Lokiarchaeia archaeon]|nr:4Fe-4S double cluster binding domain-containing protein [Candidatus Lokiarchaeia archaeon]